MAINFANTLLFCCFLILYSYVSTLSPRLLSLDLDLLLLFLVWRSYSFFLTSRYLLRDRFGRVRDVFFNFMSESLDLEYPLLYLLPSWCLFWSFLCFFSFLLLLPLGLRDRAICQIYYKLIQGSICPHLKRHPSRICNLFMLNHACQKLEL